MKNFAITFISVCLCTAYSYTQDQHFSQNNASHLMINPANTGLLHDMNATVMHRNQYSSVATPFKTSMVTFDMVTTSKKNQNAVLAVGGQFLYDDAGDVQLKTTAANLNISGILKVSDDSKLSVGLMGGYGQRGIDASVLRWDSQYQGGTYNSQLSSGENLTTQSYSYFDAGAGIAYSFGKEQSYITSNNGVKGSLGISAFHFGLPAHTFYESEETLKTKFIAHGRVELGKQNTNLTFIPSTYFMLQGNQKEIVFGNTFRYLLQEGSKHTGFKKASSIGVGASYRWMDAIIANVQIDYASYSIGFAYDFNVSSLTPVSQGRGGFELFLRFVTPNPFGKTSVARII